MIIAKVNAFVKHFLLFSEIFLFPLFFFKNAGLSCLLPGFSSRFGEKLPNSLEIQGIFFKKTIDFLIMFC